MTTQRQYIGDNFVTLEGKLVHRAVLFKFNAHGREGYIVRYDKEPLQDDPKRREYEYMILPDHALDDEW